MRNVIIFLTVALFCGTRINAQIINTLAGTGIMGTSGDFGPATAAKVNTPGGVCVDTLGNVYIADQNANVIRKVDTFGIITTYAGNGTPGYSGDGGPALAAEMEYLTGVTADRKGNIYIADEFNEVIRKVDATGIITTYAGNGTIGFSGDNGPATNAQMWHPADVGVDRMGNVYTVDQDNSAVRKIDTSGIITTVAGIPGSSGYNGDGIPATAAQLNFPQGIGVDSAGNVFVADFYNNRIRKINTVTGIITTVAGNGTAGFSGDGGQATNAEIWNASAVGLDQYGNIYVSDYYNSRVRKVFANGIIMTIAGDDTEGYSGDGGPATAAEINFPQGVTANSHGVVYIADYANARVRVVTDVPDSALPLSVNKNIAANGLKIFPNPSKGKFSVKVPGNFQQVALEIYDAIGAKVYENLYHSPPVNLDLIGFPPGVYVLHLESGNNSYIQKLIISPD